MIFDGKVIGEYLWNYDKELFHPIEGQHIIKYKNNIVDIDQIKVYEFEPETGTLKISMPKRDLEKFVSEIGFISEFGEDVRMPFPEEPGRYVKFEKVKRIECLDDLNEEKRILKYDNSGKRDNTTNYLVNSFYKREGKKS